MNHSLSPTRVSKPVAFRKVHLNTEPNSKFVTNRVITARYSILTWLPKSLLFQFTRFINYYFLLLTISSLFPFTPKNPWSLAGTHIGMLTFTIIKDGIEDIWRHKQDRQVNLAKNLKFNKKIQEFKRVYCQDLKVGDIVKVLEHESFPADCILLASSEPKGVAYLNTMSLDGENSLKEKIVNHLTADIGEKDLISAKVTFSVDQPNKSLISWNANIEKEGEILPLNMKQLLLRGCVLKNTDWVLGIIIYTGADCKIVQNSKPAKTKVSNIQKKLNFIIISVIIFIYSAALLYAGIGKIWDDDNRNSDAYINLPKTYGALETFTKALTYWIQLFTLIPISIFVVLEIMRLVLCSFIPHDRRMYNEKLDRTATWRCSDIIEELGMVEFIFSDKTGTLTKNEMELINCTIEGQDYQLNEPESVKMLSKIIEDYENPLHKSVKEFFTCLMICNSVFPTMHDGKMVYHSISPDDLALVDASKKMNYELKERNDDSFIVTIDGEEQIWHILAEVPFSSERKKMSVLIQNPAGETYLFTKGADSVMMPKLSDKGNIEEILLNYAKKGLRTLVMASKKISKKKLKRWLPQYTTLMLSNSQEKDMELDIIIQRIENKLDFLGISAIEDKLQDGVPETIELLLKANIRIWMITGDKEETAVEIGKSCKLINEGSKLLEFYHHTKEDLRNAIKFAAEEYQVTDVSMKNLHKLQSVNNLSIAFNGIALTFIIEDKEMSELFFKLAYISNTCICSRMSPIQKSEIVHLCKKYGKWISIAIGDGANDVAMIQEAHIGVGVAGKEGTQALLAAEFTLAQFSHLKRLLLVHGRYSYFRLTNFINYYFYKNFLMGAPELWYAIYCGFSGQIYFLDWLPPFFNLIWTSWPSLAFYATEQDISPRNSLKYPNLYSLGQKNILFDFSTFWRWILLSLSVVTLLFWIPMGGFPKGVGEDGLEPTLFYISTVSFIIMMNATNMKLMICNKYWNAWNMGSVLLSTVVFYGHIYLLNVNGPAFNIQPEIAGLVYDIWSRGKSWVIIILGSVITMIPDFVYEMVKLTFFATPTDKVIRYIRNKEKKRKLYTEVGYE